jgi:hypothetical protein
MSHCGPMLIEWTQPYCWRCTSAITGRRYTIRWRMTEKEARARLIDPGQ